MSEGLPIGVPTAVGGSGVDPGYPVELERLAVLADGREVFVRPIRASDAAELRRAIASADAETLHARFLGAPPHDPAAIRRLVEVDYRYRLALVAFDEDGTGVGVARYEGRPGDDVAEVAVAVAERWRGVGLGTLLLHDLGVAALHRGFRRFTALVLADNKEAMALLRRSGLAFSVQIDSGTSHVDLWLDGPGPPPEGEPNPDGPVVPDGDGARPVPTWGRSRVGKADGRPSVDPPRSAPPDDDSS